MSDDIPVSNLPSFLSQVGSLAEQPEMERPLQEFLQQLAGDLGKGFLSSQGPSGEPWKPLKRKRPPGHNQGHRPLIDTGALLASVASDGSGHVEVVTGNSAEFGTDLDYAGFQNFGTSKIPAREFMGVSDQMADLAADLIADELIIQIQGL